MLAFALRRSRLDALGAAGVIVMVGALALVTGMRMSDTYRSSGLADCLANSQRRDCESLVNAFGDRFASLQVLIWPLVLLPVMLGAFVGAPLVARELEAGTHRLWWTQGVSRLRWFLVSASVAVALAVVTGVLYSLIAGEWLDVTNRVTDERFARLYDLQGVVPVASAVLGIAIGLLCGVLFRRTVPAMLATAAGFVTVRLPIALLVRPHLASVETMSVPFTSDEPLEGTGAWMLSRLVVDRTGTVLGRDGSLDISGLAGRCPGIPAADVAPRGRLPEPEVVEACLRQLDVRLVARYHPGDRFWAFQLWESLLLVGVAGACIVAAAAVLQRRSA